MRYHHWRITLYDDQGRPVGKPLNHVTTTPDPEESGSHAFPVPGIVPPRYRARFFQGADAKVDYQHTTTMAPDPRFGMR